MNSTSITSAKFKNYTFSNTSYLSDEEATNGKISTNRPNQMEKIKSTPEWKDKIERWYQLDELSYFLCCACFQWLKQDSEFKFDQIYYLFSKSSNQADAEFVKSQKRLPDNSLSFSPSKFIYTLPNIPSSVIAQLLNWKGSIYSMGITQNLDSTKELAIQLAQNHFNHSRTKSLILYTHLNSQNGSPLEAHGLLIY